MSVENELKSFFWNTESSETSSCDLQSLTKTITHFLSSEFKFMRFILYLFSPLSIYVSYINWMRNLVLVEEIE